jgi:hypothetical protein
VIDASAFSALPQRSCKTFFHGFTNVVHEPSHTEAITMALPECATSWIRDFSSPRSNLFVRTSSSNKTVRTEHTMYEDMPCTSSNTLTLVL